jgi:multidrug transporter EmrE-like cation transporter
MTSTTESAIVSGSNDVTSWVNLMVAIVLLNGGNLMLDDVAKASGITFDLFFSLRFVVAIACLGFAFLFYVRSLARLPLAVAYPVMVGLSMIIVAVANYYWLGAPLASLQLAGVFVLFIGVVLISTGSNKSS